MKRVVITASLLIISSGALGDSFDDSFLDNVRLILSATKLEQSSKDVPGSVTVITADQIRERGITNIPEALRFVPGMLMTQASAHDYRVSYHGTNGLIPRRMQILVDGVSVYRNGLARIDWLQLPIPVENIERIEVIRGPSSATYGSNSFQAAINIISKSAATQAGGEVTLRRGSQDNREVYARYGDSAGNTDFVVTLKTKNDGGFDTSIDDDLSREYSEDALDDSELSVFNFATNTQLSDDKELTVNVGYVEANLEWEFGGGVQLEFPDSSQRDYLLDAKFGWDISADHSLLVSGYAFQTDIEQGWRTCALGITMTEELRELHIANPEYVDTILKGGVPSGGTAADDMLALAVFQKAATMGSLATDMVCGDLNHDIKDGKRGIEVQDTYVFSDNLRVVSAIGYQSYYSDSETFLDGKVEHEKLYLFSNAEIKPHDEITINAGFMYERESTLDGENSVSPRIALNYHYLQNHTIKLVYSEGRRTPDILESDRFWRYRLTDIEPLIDGSSSTEFYVLATPTSELKSEKIISREVIFHGMFGKSSSYDVKIFEEKLSDLISEKLGVFDYDPTNNNSGDITGYEFEMETPIDDQTTVSVGYAFLDAEFTHEFETTLHATHSGFASVSHVFDGYVATASYVGNSGAGGDSYDRLDINIVGGVSSLFDDIDMHWSIKASHLFSDNVSSIEDVGSEKVKNSFSNQTQYYISLGLKI